MTQGDAPARNQGLPHGEHIDSWFDPCGSIMVRVVDWPYGDPVEMGPEQARELATRLLKLADEHDAHDA